MIRELETERAQLMARLGELERRETALRSEGGSQLESLQSEHRALEELLDEALSEMRTKEDEIRALQRQVKKQERAERRPLRRATPSRKRLRTLYKNLEIDDRAVDDVSTCATSARAARGGEPEAALATTRDQAQVRRKVGGLPPHLSIFELGFGGGGRIYFTKGRVRRHRILLGRHQGHPEARSRVPEPAARAVPRAPRCRLPAPPAERSEGARDAGPEQVEAFRVRT